MGRRKSRSRLDRTIEAIQASDLSIYDSLEDLPRLYLDTKSLQAALLRGLLGLNLNYPIRTRSKVLKAKVCEALGYPVPQSFRRTKPRFPGQNFDAYVQKSNNLQIWNQEITASRRYVLVRVDARSVVSGVRVVTGDVLAQWDRTGTLTHKFQAKSRAAVSSSALVSATDTDNVVRRLVRPRVEISSSGGELTTGIRPNASAFVPISALFKLLRSLVGSIIPDPGRDQERNRGAGLQRLVSKRLGTVAFADSGQFPDIRSQLLELKLQTAPTIDLALASPDSTEPLANLPDFHHCDVRYGVFYGATVPSGVRLNAVVVTTGADFFTFFQRFAGMIRNAKLQIPLPAGFFEQTK